MSIYVIKVLSKIDTVLITACKRSLGQGNIFTSVCQEFCSRGGLVPGLGGLFPGLCLVPGVWSQGGGVSGPRGRGTWLGVPGPGEVPGGDPPGWPLLLVECILLECILVIVENSWNALYT